MLMPAYLPASGGHLAVDVYRDDLLQFELPEQLDVMIVTVAADHHGARAERSCRRSCARHRHFLSEDRDDHVLADELLVAVVVGMDDDQLAGFQQLRPGRSDQQFVTGCPSP